MVNLRQCFVMKPEVTQCFRHREVYYGRERIEFLRHSDQGQGQVGPVMVGSLMFSQQVVGSGITRRQFDRSFIGGNGFVCAALVGKQTGQSGVSLTQSGIKLQGGGYGGFHRRNCFGHRLITVIQQHVISVGQPDIGHCIVRVQLD